MAEVIGYSTASGWQSTTPLTVPEGVQEGDLLYVFLTANGEQAIDTVPTGWTLVPEGTEIEGSLGTQTAVRLYVREATEDDESEPTYNWVWDTEHWRSGILIAVHGALSVREVGIATAMNTDVLDAPSLDAEEHDLLVLWAYQWSEDVGSVPTFSGLDEIVSNPPYTSAAQVEIDEDGPTEEYTASSTLSGRMAVVAVLFEGDEPEPDPEPQVIWQNTFDGVSGSITTANSGNYGDAVTAVTGEASYQTSERAHGAGAAQLGSASGTGEMTIDLDPAVLWSLRCYIYVPDGSSFLMESETVNNPNTALFYAAYDGTGAPFISILAGIPTEDLEDDLRDQWVRFEVRCYDRVFNSLEAGIWWTDPESTGEPDYFHTAGSFSDRDLIQLRLIRDRLDPGVAFIDQLTVGDGSDWVGPYEPGSDLVIQNTLDGPDGVAVTTLNSGDYGTPVSSAIGSPTYVDVWAAQGSSSVELLSSAGIGCQISWFVSPHMSQFAVRFYALIPEDSYLALNLGGLLSFIVDDEVDVYTWVTEDIGPDAANIIDQPFRAEVLRVDYTITLRLYWTDIHAPADEFDFEQTEDVFVGDLATNSFNFVGSAGPVNAPSYIDEVVVQEAGAGWIGPAVDGGSEDVEVDVLFSGEAAGTPDIAGFVEAGVEYSTEVEGTKLANSGITSHVVEYSTELEYDAREVGLAIHGVEYSTEAVGVPERDTDAVADVEYSGDIEWFTDRSGEGDADIVYLPEAGGESRITLPDVTRVGLRYRLVAYDPNGDVRGQIPLPLSFQLGVPLNDLPSLALEYLRSAPGAELLNDHCEVAVELATLTSPSYVEYPGCRFINLRNQSDPSDRTGNVKYTMPHYGWQLRKARVLTGLDEEGQRSFSNATFGQIMHTLLVEAQSRGWNTGMSWDFTPQRDSAGQVWDNVFTLSFDAGQDLWTILDTFAQQAACDFRFHRRTLQVYNADTALNRDRTSQAVLHLNRDITAAPNDWTSEELASRVLVRGDEGSSVMLTVPNAAQPWGTWETYVNQSGVTDTGTLTTLARWTLEKARVPLVQMTRGILFPTAQYMPFRDYQPGDYVTAPGSADQPWGTNDQSELRVRQITLVSVDHQGMEGALVLNERFIESSLRRDRLLNALTGGAGSNPGGGGGGTPPREDTRTPRAPTGLVVGSETYINEIGEPRGQITATWELVDEATNGTEMDIRTYEVWVRWAAFNQPWQFQTSVDHPTNQAFMSPFNPDEVYEVRVRAIGRNMRPSAYSTTVPILVEGDAEPPEIPAAPILESRLGVVRATWNGLDFQGLPMAPDFDHVAVWMSETASEEDGWERIDTLYRTGVSVIPDLAYDTEFFFRFTALDRSGNESEPSSISSISVQQLVPGDITPGSIGYELLAEGAVRDDILADDAVRNRHVAAGEITGEKIRAYSIFADRIAVGNTRNLLTDPKNLDEDLNALRLDLADGEWTYTNSVTHAQNMPTLSRSDNPNGTYRYYWVQSIEADSINDLNAGYRVQAELGRAVSSTLVTVAGRSTGVVAVTGFVRLLNREGGLITQPGTTAEVSLNSNVTDFELISSNGTELPPEAVSAVFYVRVVLTGVNEGASVSFARPFSALNDGQVLIENGAITANKIAANSVTADKIVAGSIQAVHIAADAITTDKLAANAITAKHTITGALVQTTATANRGLKIDNVGMRGFDNVGNQTFTYSAATGNVTITGRFQSGLSGTNRVVVSDVATWGNNPGVTLISGASGARDSNYFMSVPNDGSGFSNYATVITGSEVTRNSSGRTDLVIAHGNGGGGRLEYQWSSNYLTIGLNFDTWHMRLRGRMENTHYSRDRRIWGRSSTYNDATNRISFTYGQAAPNGGRAVQITPTMNASQWPVIASSVVQSSLSSFTATTHRVNQAVSYRVIYTTTWVSGAAW